MHPTKNVVIVATIAVAPTLTAPQHVHPLQMWIMYSEVSLSTDATHPSTLLGVYALLHSLGIPVGFVTESQLASGTVARDIANRGEVLVLPTGTSCVGDVAAARLGEVAANVSEGVVVVGITSQLDNTLARDERCRLVSAQEAARRAWVRAAPRFIPVDTSQVSRQLNCVRVCVCVCVSVCVCVCA